MSIAPHLAPPAPVPGPSPLSLVSRRRVLDAEDFLDAHLDVVVAVAQVSGVVAYAVLVDGRAPALSAPAADSATCDALFAAFADVVVGLPADRTWRVGISNTRFLNAFEPLAASWPHIQVVSIPHSHPVMVVAHAEASRRLSPYAKKETHRTGYRPPRLVIATDGSSGNRGSQMRGGYGWVDENGRFGAGVLASGQPLDAEISAIIDVLTKTKANRRLKILVDSASAIAVAQAAAEGAAHAPRRALGQGLYGRLCVLLKGRDVAFVRVIGHDGHPLNEAADRLSRHARRANDMSVASSVVVATQAEIVAEQLAAWEAHRAEGATSGTPRRHLRAVG